MFKEKMAEVGTTFWYTMLVLFVFALLVFGGLLIEKYAYPWWLGIQRQSVESSKSFTDANNNMLETYKLEYVRLDTKIAESGDNTNLISTYKAQQMAIVEKMCRQISTMKIGTVNPTTTQWLNSKGGCK